MFSSSYLSSEWTNKVNKNLRPTGNITMEFTRKHIFNTNRSQFDNDADENSDEFHFLFIVALKILYKIWINNQRKKKEEIKIQSFNLIRILISIIIMFIHACTTCTET